jgi:ribosomal protein S18 acetylase RimI-like enzyme
MVIRNIKESDLQPLVGLYLQFWGEVSNLPKMQKKFVDLMDNPMYIFMCAEIDGKLVGTIQGIICDELIGECQPFIVMENLVTDKEFRNKGVAKSLLAELESIAKKKNCSQILFITESDRFDAVSFYESQGYNAKTHIGFKKKL